MSKLKLLVLLLALLPTQVAVSADWPAWRGPAGNGVASTSSAPLQWSESKNLHWKADVRGTGNSSPIVVGNIVLLTTASADLETQSVIAFDRTSGRGLWETVAHKGKLVAKMHKMCTHASCSVATNGELVFASFMNDNAIWTTALDLRGKIVWQKRVCDFDSQFGYGTSPIVYRELVIVAVDNKGGNSVFALDAKTGAETWNRPRPNHNSYVTPSIFKIQGKDQLLLSGCLSVNGYDPKSGEQFWTIGGGAQMAVGSVVSDGELVFVSGGWPQKTTLCVRPATKETVWKNNAPTYIPSMIVHQEHLYAVTNEGVAYCWEKSTGSECWRERLGGKYSSSLLLLRDHLLISNEDGVTKVFPASPERLEVVHENNLPGLTRATPAVSGDRIFLRTTAGLFCVGS